MCLQQQRRLAWCAWLVVVALWAVACVSPPLPLMLWPVLALFVLSALARVGGR